LFIAGKSFFLREEKPLQDRTINRRQINQSLAVLRPPQQVKYIIGFLAL
jgi:hypothetical protein